MLAGPVPAPSREAGAQLFAAGGFVLGGQRVANHCGGAANPGLTFADMNGDGVDEAVFVDAGTCYPGGHRVAIVARQGESWIPVLMAPATAQPVNHLTNGWHDVAVDFGTVQGVMQFDGSRYVAGAAVPGGVAPAQRPERPKVAAAPVTPVTPAPATPAPVTPETTAPGAGAGETRVTLDGAPTPAQVAAVERAMGGEWAEVVQTEGHPVAYSVAEADLNEDGHPDLLLQASDIACCGSLGCGSRALLAMPQGYAATPITLAVFAGALFVRAGLHRGMHDLRFGDASYVFRWNGRAYH